MGLGRHEVHPLGQAELVHQRGHLLHLGIAVEPAGPTHHDERGVRSTEGGQRPDGDIDALEGLDPADEQQHRRIAHLTTQIDRAPGAHPIAGREEGVLHPGRHDLDATRGVAVVATELALLLGAAHADGVGAADDLHLGQLAPGGLGVAAFSLDASERVEGAHEGQIEIVLDAMPGHPREPVVGVDQVGAPVGLQVIGHADRELPDDVEEALLGEVGPAGVDVHHAEPGLDDHLVREIVRPAAHVGRGVDARLGQRRGQLAHVDVHPAAVAHARLGQRRRVHGEHGEPPHGQVNAPSRTGIPLAGRVRALTAPAASRGRRWAPCPTSRRVRRAGVAACTWASARRLS